MTRDFRADLRLLLRPINVVVLAAVFVVGIMTCWITRKAATRQLSVVRSALVENGLDPTVGACGMSGPIDVQACLASASGPTDTVFVDSLLRQYARVVEASDATSALGAIGFASRQSASMVGFLALAIIVVLHCSVPWESGSIRALVPAIGVRRLVAQKCLSVMPPVIAIPVVSYMGVVSGSLIPVPGDLPRSELAWAPSLRDLAGSLLVLTLLGLVAAAISLLTRSLVVAFTTFVVFLSISYIGTLAPELYGWSPAGWVATVMQFDDDSRRQVVDFFWAASTARLDGPVAVVLLVALAAVPLGVASAWLPHRRPVG